MEFSKKYRIIVCLFSIFILCLFYIFSHEVKQGFLKKVDFDTTVKLQERIDTSSRLRLSATVGNVLEGSTFFSSPEVSLVAVGILTLLALIDIRNKKVRLRALLIPILLGFLILGELYGKNVVHHPAPPYFMIKNPTTIFPKYYVNEQFSYPSGHTARAVFLGITCYSVFIIHNSIFKRKKLYILLAVGVISYIFMVSISRIYLGHHWLSDVIGGGLLGAGLGLLTLTFNSPIIDEQ